MQYDYYYQAGQMRLTALRQEAERERLIQAVQRETPAFYHRWSTWLGRRMMQVGQQLIQFGNRGRKRAATPSPRHALLPVKRYA